MIDKLLDRISERKAPWWVWLLIVASFILSSYLSARSKLLRVQKKVEEIRADKKAVSEALKAIESSEIELESRFESAQKYFEKVRSLDKKISEVEKRKEAALARIARARSLSDLQ